MNFIQLCFCFLMFVNIVFRTSYSLECYVCTNQDHNTKKCLNTIRTCEQGEDVCLTEIKWGTTPYWTQGAEKQYYISKRCSTEDECVRTRDKYMQQCTHIWYEDWKCAQCCKGDRCNYYVILSGSIARASITVLGLSTLAVMLARKLWNI